MLTSVQDNPEKNVEMRKIKEKHVKTHKNAEKLTKTFKKHIMTWKIGENVGKCRQAPKSTPMEAPWASPGHVLVVLGRSWDALGCSWDALGRLLAPTALESSLFCHGNGDFH